MAAHKKRKPDLFKDRVRFVQSEKGMLSHRSSIGITLPQFLAVKSIIPIVNQFFKILSVFPADAKR
jgi:hypothetical protein